MKPTEFPKGSGILIREVINKHGGEKFGKSFIVNIPAKLTGRNRERKQFDSFDKARDYATNTAGGVRAIGGQFVEMNHTDREDTLRLLKGIQERGGETADVVDDVLAALKSIGASPVRLNECVAYALPRLAPAKVVTVSECAASLLESMAGQVSAEHIRVTKINLSRLTAKFGQDPVSHLDAVKINGLVSGLRTRDRKDAEGKIVPGKAASPKFRKHVLGSTRQLVRHAVSRGWMAKGIVDFEIIEKPRKAKGGKIEIWSPEEIAGLLKAALESKQVTDRELVPFLVVGAFSGLRSAEIERLDWSEVDLVQGHIEVGADKAKTASRRFVPIVDNLKAWLAPMHRKSGRVFEASTTAGRLTVRLQALAKLAGLPRWKKNALRHSFCSYRTAKIQNVNQVALEAGNSVQMIFQHYRNAVKPADAEKWFGVMPDPAAVNIIRFPAVA